jgi:hypothetical protein
MVLYSGFTDFSSIEKLSVIIGFESVNVIKAGAKICYEILEYVYIYIDVVFSFNKLICI